MTDLIDFMGRYYQLDNDEKTISILLQINSGN